MCKSKMCMKKCRFRDIELAKQALICLRTSKRSRIPFRYYACPHCKGFHLTSQPL